MRKRDHLKYGLIRGIIVCCSAALTALDNVASAESVETDSPVRPWPHHHPPIGARRPVNSHEDHGSPPVLTTVTSTISAAVAAEATPSPIPTTATTNIGIYQRNNPIFATISSLSGALEEAESNAIYISSLMATSIIGLQESIDYLTSSASSALASVQASASSAIASAEESASNAMIAAERSASSKVSSMSSSMGDMLDQGDLVTVTVTETVVSFTTELIESTITFTADPSSTDSSSTMAPNDSEAQNENDIKAVQGAALSVNRAAIAVVVAIIGSSVLSLAGFYLFVRYRKRKQKQKEEEQNVSDALDRAIVSYIVKDQASPTTKDGDPSSPTGPPEPIHLETIEEVNTPPPDQGPLPPPVLRPSQAYRPLQTPQTPQFEPPAGISPRRIGQAVSKDYSIDTLPSPGPPPTIPLPTPPATKDMRRNISIRCAPESRDSVYGDILARPLTSVTTDTSVMSGASGGFPLGHARAVSSTVAGSIGVVGRMASSASTSARGRHARRPLISSRGRVASTGSVRPQGQGMGDQQQLLQPQQQQQQQQPERRDERRNSNWPLPKSGLV
ncbi:hypothetical protein QBC32DRAFT_312155 [Pseudoneurospora amorphoporcata]|uniref:Mid2 domain-containing protein n=1 Tax=Pseudoneurospora amorphoporcata TaxID=241081 RepID=A0AAN6NY85_9PEZI|nr:hypothetical protein QBC32DRAFT_312155 [Pseudoneurospora amorphoporcata]